MGRQVELTECCGVDHLLNAKVIALESGAFVDEHSFLFRGMISAYPIPLVVVDHHRILTAGTLLSVNH